MFSADDARALSNRYEFAKEQFEALVKRRAAELRSFAIMTTDDLGLSDADTARLCEEFRTAGFQVSSDATGVEVSWREKP